jgi:hypothetical protein
LIEIGEMSSSWQMNRLTKAEQELRSEIEQIAAAIEMDVWDVEDHVPGPSRRYYLQEMKRKFVKSERGGPVFRNRMAAWLRWILGSITPPISPGLPA